MYVPATSGPVDGDALIDLLSAAVRGVLALPGDLVRPSWQPNPPLVPPIETNWCAHRIANVLPDVNPVVATTGDAGYLSRTETMEWQLSFYGPSCQANAGLLRDGLEVPANREALREQGVVIADSGPTRHMPELVNDLWYDRADLTLTIARDVRRAYLILSFVSASGVIHGHGPDPTINVPFSAKL